MRTLTIFRNQ